MQSILPAVYSSIWATHAGSPGKVIEGDEVLKQRILIALSTEAGSDPLRANFASKIYKYADKPANIAIPNIKNEIVNAINIWVPDVTVNKIVSSTDTNGSVIFRVSFTQSNLQVVINNSNGLISFEGFGRQLILESYTIPNQIALNISLTLNNNAASPVPPSTGFADLDSMYTWVVTNWSGYGSWGKSKSSIIGYINTNYSIGTLNIYQVS